MVVRLGAMSMISAPRRTSPSITGTVGSTILRVVLGVTFLLHGWQKFDEWTLAGTAASFGEMGVPMADVMGPAVAILELVGGALLIVGLGTRVVAALLTLNMLGAMFLVHAAAGFFASEGGIELVLILAAVSLFFALAGPGRLSLDALIAGRRRTAPAAESRV